MRFYKLKNYFLLIFACLCVHVSICSCVHACACTEASTRSQHPQNWIYRYLPEAYIAMWVPMILQDPLNPELFL